MLRMGLAPPAPLGLILIGFAGAAAVLDWVAVTRGDKRAEYLLKPLTMVFLIGAAALMREGVPQARWVPTIVALSASLLGDVFLMLRNQRFVAGVGSFLVAHLAYVAAFRTLGVDGPTLATAAAVLVVGSILYARLRRGMRASGQEEMALPVAVYFLAIAAMLTSALVTPFRAAWDGPHSAAAITGAILFVTSDSLIGWTRFVRSWRWGHLAIIVTYHLAQVALLLALLG
jgi:uncharacterized membrane protein YhhN